MPTVTPTATYVVTPGFLRPDLGATKRKLKVSRKRVVKVRVRCVPVGSYALPARCRGSVRLYAKLDRKRRVGRKAFSIVRGGTKTVRVKLRKRAHRKLRRKRRLRATVRATANGRQVIKRVKLRR